MPKASSSSLPLIMLLLIIFGVVSYAAFNYLPGNIEKTRALVTNTLTKDDVRSIVKEEIEKNPEMIGQALKSLQAKQVNEEASKSKDVIGSNLDELQNDPKMPFAGNEKGDVTVVEFFDYSCGYCKRSASVIADLIKSDPNVKVIFREWPILGANSQLAAQVALAVHAVDPKKYFEVHTAFMGNNFATEQALLDAVGKAGVNVAQVKTAMTKPEINDAITKNKTLARLIGIQGTPAFIIGGELIPGAIDLDAFKAKVAEAKARAAAPTSEKK